MKDIFSIISHEDHKMEVVSFDNQIKLGCRDCGVTILEETSDKFNLDELIKFIDKSGNKSIKKMIRTFATEVITKQTKSSMEETIKCINEKIRKTLNTTTYVVSSSVDKTFIEILSDKLEFNEKYLKNLCDILNFDLETYVEMTKKSIIENNSERFLSITDREKEIVVSNSVYKVSTYADLLSVNKDWMESKEELTPTAKDIKEVKTIGDYIELIPDWDNEEDNDDYYKEFIYRSKNNLYDFKFENADYEIIKNALGFFEDYESVSRYSVPAFKALERLNNNNNNIQLNERVIEFLNGVINDLSGQVSDSSEETLLLVEDLKKLLSK